MGEDEREGHEGQSEPESQPPSESEADDNQRNAEGQPPPATPIPVPTTQRRRRWQYILGLVLGLIPLIVFLVGYGFALRTPVGSVNTIIGTSLLGLLFYIVEIILAIAFLVRKNLRFAGYGLLTAFLATPIVAAIGCSVIPNLIHA